MIGRRAATDAKRPAAPALPELLARLVAATERALAACDAEDTAALDAALDERATLLPALAKLLHACTSPAATMPPASLQLVRQLRALDGELVERVRARRDALEVELRRATRALEVTAAYAGSPRHVLDSRR